MRPIYNDDPTAIAQLTAKLAGLEAQRQRINAINGAIRRHGYTKVKREAIEFDPYRAPLLTPRLTAAEMRQLESLAARGALERGFPPYTASNLTSLIAKTRKRLAVLDAARV